MKRLIQLGVILCAIFLVVACGRQKVKGSGTITTQSRTVASFDHIKVSGTLNVVIIANEAQAVTVTADDNLQSYIVFAVKNNTLQVSSKRDYELVPTKPIQVKIAAPKLKSVGTAGSVEINVTGIDNKTFDLHCSGYSQAMLAGEVNKASIGIDGSGMVDARKLVAKEVSLDVSGSGKAMVMVKRKLNVKISGSGQVMYYGNPPIINQAVFGSGKIQKGSE